MTLVISRLTVVSREAKEEVPCDGLSTNARESRLTVVSREAKEEVPCDGLSTNAREYIYKNKPC